MPTPSTQRARPHGTVIVVDDVEAMRELVITFLRKADASLTLVAASTAYQALAMVESYASLGPDPSERVVVISDVRMPGLDGLTLLRNLASSPHEVHAILMTAFPDDGLRARASELGALACFEKPFDLEVLGALVSRIVHAPERGARLG
jgi:CheY-like chemotaxis protein